MKKNFILPLLLLGILISFNACKKSKNDPFLPFSTRDARITNSWVLSLMNVTITEEINAGDPFVKTWSYIFDGSTMTETNTDGFGSSTEEYSYSHELEILKEGTYLETINNNNNKTEVNSTWYWYDANKNKIGIILSESGTFMIDRLAKDELILKQSSVKTETNEDGIKTINTEDIVMNFRKK